MKTQPKMNNLISNGSTTFLGLGGVSLMEVFPQAGNGQVVVAVATVILQLIQLFKNRKRRKDDEQQEAK